MVSQLNSFCLCSCFMLTHCASDTFIIIVKDSHICIVTGEQSRFCHWPGSRLWTNVLILHLHFHICKIEMAPTCSWESAGSCVAFKKEFDTNKYSVDANIVIIILLLLLYSFDWPGTHRNLPASTEFWNMHYHTQATSQFLILFCDMKYYQSQFLFPI